MKAIEGAIRDGMRFGKNRISVRSDSQRIVDRFNQDRIKNRASLFILTRSFPNLDKAFVKTFRTRLSGSQKYWNSFIRVRCQL